MRVEGRGNHLHVPPPPFLYSPPQDLLVAEVHAIEVPESHDYSAHSTTSARPHPHRPYTRPTARVHTSPCNCHRPDTSLYAFRGTPCHGPPPQRLPPQEDGPPLRAEVLCG